MLPSDYQVSVDNLKNITKAKANHFGLDNLFYKLRIIYQK